jgi:hypothetical protein
MLVFEIQTRYLGKDLERVSKQGSSSIIDDIMSRTDAFERKWERILPNETYCPALLTKRANMTSFIRTCSSAAYFLLSLTPKNSAMMLNLEKLSNYRTRMYVAQKDKHVHIHEHPNLNSSHWMLFVKSNMAEMLLSYIRYCKF